MALDTIPRRDICGSARNDIAQLATSAGTAHNATAKEFSDKKLRDRATSRLVAPMPDWLTRHRHLLIALMRNSFTTSPEKRNEARPNA